MAHARPTSRRTRSARCAGPATCRREHEEPRVVETPRGDGTCDAYRSSDTGTDTWNGCVVGGATNFMSGFFLRMKPEDFRLRSTFGPVDGADVVDWPLGYDDLEPWYDLVETRGRRLRARDRAPARGARGRARLPVQPPTGEHVLARRVDEAGARGGSTPSRCPARSSPRTRATRQEVRLHGLLRLATAARPAPRARRAPRSSGAPSRPAAARSAPAAPRASSRPTRPAASSRVHHHGDPTGRSSASRRRVVVVACQPLETARLLLLSTGPEAPAAGSATPPTSSAASSCRRPRASAGACSRTRRSSRCSATPSATAGAFVNRTFQDWQDYVDPAPGARRKGGNVDFLLMHREPRPERHGPGVVGRRRGSIQAARCSAASCSGTFARWFRDAKALQVRDLLRLDAARPTAASRSTPR